MTAFVSET